MNLKKSDKIIAAIGILIIIVAVLAIVYYVTTEDEDKPEEEIESMKYDVTWYNATGSMTLEGFAQKKVTYEDSFTINVPSGAVLTDVDVTFDWKDDKTFGLGTKRIIGKFFKVKGLDTLTAEISMTDGAIATYESVGENTDEVVSFKVNSKPMDEQLEAKDQYEVEDMLDELYGGKDSASFNVKVDVSIGEKGLRLLKIFLDKGNSFTINIKYEYFRYTIEELEPENNNEDMEETVLDTSLYYKTMSSLGRDY